MNEISLVILAYFIGSIPTAVWVSKSRFNIDIRDYGSGNAGATNSFRILGARWGTFVMIFDMLKGLMAVKLAYLVPYYLENDFQGLSSDFRLCYCLVSYYHTRYPSTLSRP